jgi:hypothetical protein
MSNIFNIFAASAVAIGTTYFILRLTTFSRVTSVNSELRNMMAFEYFLTIKSADSKISRITIKWLNWLLRITYLFYAVSMAIAIAQSFIDEFSK